MAMVLTLEYEFDCRRCCDSDVPTDVGWFCVSDD